MNKSMHPAMLFAIALGGAFGAGTWLNDHYTGLLWFISILMAIVAGAWTTGLVLFPGIFARIASKIAAKRQAIVPAEPPRPPLDVQPDGVGKYARPRIYGQDHLIDELEVGLGRARAVKKLTHAIATIGLAGPPKHGRDTIYAAISNAIYGRPDRVFSITPGMYSANFDVTVKSIINDPDRVLVFEDAERLMSPNTPQDALDRLKGFLTLPVVEYGTAKIPMLRTTVVLSFGCDSSEFGDLAADMKDRPGERVREVRSRLTKTFGPILDKIDIIDSFATSKKTDFTWVVLLAVEKILHEHGLTLKKVDQKAVMPLIFSELNQKDEVSPASVARWIEHHLNKEADDFSKGPDARLGKEVFITGQSDEYGRPKLLVLPASAQRQHEAAAKPSQAIPPVNGLEQESVSARPQETQTKDERATAKKQADVAFDDDWN